LPELWLQMYCHLFVVHSVHRTSVARRAEAATSLGQTCSCRSQHKQCSKRTKLVATWSILHTPCGWHQRLSLLSEVVTCEIKQKQNTETILKRFRIDLELFQAHYHIYSHVEKYANPKTVLVVSANRQRPHTPLTMTSLTSCAIIMTVTRGLLWIWRKVFRLADKPRLFCFVSAFCFTCKHAKIKKKQFHWNKTLFCVCFVLVLFQFYFSCNHGIKRGRGHHRSGSPPH